MKNIQRFVITSLVSLILLPCIIFAEDLQAPFELHDNDRVVLLGNSLFERELRHGYIELALTTRWPDRNITVRNLGWTGDTVFGEARGYFTTPPDAYGHLIEQLTNAKPTIVFVAYGGVEAYKGEEGLPRFSEGLHKLLDKIEELNAEAVLLSPIPKFPTDITASFATDHNQIVEKYSETISGIADQRGVRFIDIFTPLMKIEDGQKLTTNGIHLNETGYIYLAGTIESALNLTPREWAVSIDLDNGQTYSKGVSIADFEHRKNEIQFKAKDEWLPLPHSDRVSKIETRLISVSGLEEGRYTLTIDADYEKTATASEWEDGVEIYYGTSFTQAGLLQNRIVRKNNLFFNQYRPQNRTYITGFRSYEQGQNVSELHQLDELIEQEEREIFKIRKPNTNVYRLVKSR
ncbi:MAG: SGNH/GDSL hydrolase family protein [Balneolaceae bacterium]|nr:SGNH/GDSL hydrolase family protein [Balneolaceae bacterium]